MEVGMENKTSARDKILKTTLSIIGEEGFQNITVRKIRL
jgi:AcrR family transcriptional regulator